MKKRIIDIAVIVVMSVIANYPMYNTLRGAAEDFDVVLQAVQADVIQFQEDIHVVRTKVEIVRVELIDMVDSNLGIIDSTAIKMSQETLRELDRLEFMVGGINKRVNSILKQQMDSVLQKEKENVLERVPVPSIKSLDW
jgi:hypothetical protein|tara:strand:+ start:303 stop:719 length:417 start_codon:yes stop_codon:yes gene_type:complete